MINKFDNGYWFENLFLKSWRSYFWIIGIGFLLYFPTLFFNFTYLDDNSLIIDNEIFLKNPASILLAFKQSTFRIISGTDLFYRPILTISFILDAQLGGIKPFIYHFTNLAFHLVASSLVYLFLCRFGYERILSFIFTVIFTVHPVLTQAVAWIPGRNDSLLAIFTLVSFIYLIGFLKEGRLYQMLLHFLFFTLALFTKESAAILILIWFIYLGLFKPNRVTTKNLIVFMISWLFIFSVWFLLRSTAYLSSNIHLTPALMKSIIVHFPAVIIYIGKLLFPFNLSVLPIIRDSTKLYGIVAIILLFISLSFSKEKRYNFIIFGLSWFLLFLLPTFILLPTFMQLNRRIYVPFFEHRIYLSMVGFIILLLEIDFIKKLNIKKKFNFLVFILIVLILSVATLSYSENFRNSLNFWQSAVRTSPHSPWAHESLGTAYYSYNLLDKAEAEYKEALSLNPKDMFSHNNLGLFYMQKGMLKEAEEEYKKALATNPFYDKVNFNLGALYFQQGNYKAGEELWKKTLQINPDFFGAYYHLIMYYHKNNNHSQVEYYIKELNKRGVKLTPEFLKLLNVD